MWLAAAILLCPKPVNWTSSEEKKGYLDVISFLNPYLKFNLITQRKKLKIFKLSYGPLKSLNQGILFKNFSFVLRTEKVLKVLTGLKPIIHPLG